MENATKALLIAAAVLVAILIISLGLVVYNMAAETVQGVNMSETEIQAHNDQFMRYEGEAQRGSQVNALLQTALNNNLDATDEGKKVEVKYKSSSTATEETLVEKNQTKSPKKVDTGATYKVTAEYDENSKLITKINVEKRTSSGGTTNTTP